MNRLRKWQLFGLMMIAVALAAIWATLNEAEGEVIGRRYVRARPLDGWSGLTSNTAELFGFYGVTSQAGTPTYSTGDWATTVTQYWSDPAATATLSRIRMNNWLQVTNMTTFPIYLTVNCGWQPAPNNGDWFMNETTPTLSPDEAQFFLMGASDTTGSWQLQIQRTDFPDLFPVENVGVYLKDDNGTFYTSAALQAVVTSQTLQIDGQ